MGRAGSPNPCALVPCYGICYWELWISQGHRMAEVGREPFRSFGPNPGQAGSPTAICPGPCPGSFSLSQRWRLHNISVQPVPLLGHCHSYVLPEAQRFPRFSKRFHLAYGAEPLGFSSFFLLLLLILFKKIQLTWPQIWRDYLHMSPNSVCLTTQISVCSGYCTI